MGGEQTKILSEDGLFESIAEPNRHGRWVVRQKIEPILKDIFPLLYLKKFTSYGAWRISKQYVMIRNKDFILFESHGVYYFSFPTLCEEYINDKWRYELGTIQSLKPLAVRVDLVNDILNNTVNKAFTDNQIQRKFKEEILLEMRAKKFFSNK